MARKTLAASAPATLREKVKALATLQGALRAETQRAELGEALARTRLGDALLEAMAARAKAEAATREAVWARYRAAARERPDRRNRLRILAEQALNKLGPLGQALVIARSGLWRTADGSRFAALPAMAAYAGRGPDPAAQPPALIDQAWYLGAYPDVSAARMSPLVHYLLRGGAEARSPHPLFDGQYYQRHNAPDLAGTGLSPLAHFERLGAARGRAPHPLFDIAYYVQQAPELIESGENPLAHYLRLGAARDLSPHRLFQPLYYRRQLPPADRGADPLVHYLTVGWRQGLKPHPLFDPAWYLERYPDVTGEPLGHFAEYAGEQLRSPGPWFDSEHYARTRGDGRATHLDPLSDYLARGAWTAAEPAPGFHPAAYLAAHPELAGGALTPIEHWADRAR